MTDNIFRNKQVPTRICACGECWKRPADELRPKVEQTSDGYEKAIASGAVQLWASANPARE